MNINSTPVTKGIQHFANSSIFKLYSFWIEIFSLYDNYIEREDLNDDGLDLLLKLIIHLWTNLDILFHVINIILQGNLKCH